MLTELRIENFAIIDQLELHLKPGLITFTGETGAGKSIIIDAFETVLGGRTDTSMVRVGAERAIVEATFHILTETGASIFPILRREELLEDSSPPYALVLGREIRTNGRSIARVNGRTVHIGLLRELGDLLVDVHGQSEHLSLMRVVEHIGLLDRYAGTEDLLKDYGETYKHLRVVRHDLDGLRRVEKEAARRTDILHFQINEIEAAHLHPGEEEELRAERTRLVNAEGLAVLAQQAVVALDEGTPESPCAVDLLGDALKAVENIVRLDPTQAGQAGKMHALYADLTDLAGAVRDYLEGIEFNPKRLDQVEERLNLIHILKRKYGETMGNNSSQAILNYAQDARQQLESIQHTSERIAELQIQETSLLEELGKHGQALSTQRHLAALNLQKEIEGELNDLQMPGARFLVDFQEHLDPAGVRLPDDRADAADRRVAFNATGLEDVEFMIAPNPGEDIKPLVKIASGGETSRLMLALKDVLARADHIPSLIFDEIDQGIGGRVGAIVGQKLWKLARIHQVLCITHLPQLAAFGEQHILVRKQMQAGRTLTLADDIQGEARLRELAQMMGDISPGTLQSAREMIETVGKMVVSSQTNG